MEQKVKPSPRIQPLPPEHAPELKDAFAQLTALIWEPGGEAGGALHFGIDEQRLAPVWEFRTSPLYLEADRTALDFAIADASVPNGVTDEMFATMRKHWSESQIVEIVAVVATFGFLNRWNDTMGTPLEGEPMAVGERFLAPHGWSAGKHGRAG